MKNREQKISSLYVKENDFNDARKFDLKLSHKPYVFEILLLRQFMRQNEKALI